MTIDDTITAIESGSRGERSQNDSKHYFALDFVRGLAAIAVIFWHYQHFLMLSVSQEIAPAQRELLPLYAFFAPLYDYGYIAVQVFWILSGFVFAAVYVEHKATTASFFWARFARLYPLHLLTLITVAILQCVSVVVVGFDQIYSNNDLYHFVLQLLFLPEWGFQNGYSFNGPIWSVSAEIFIYIVFWCLVPTISKSRFNLASIIALLCYILANYTSLGWRSVYECGLYFFMGVAIWRIDRDFKASPAVFACISCVSLISGLGILVNERQLAATIAIPCIAFGTLGLAIAADNSVLSHYFKPAKSFGDLTYGFYLWHVPIQIAIMIVLRHWARPELVYSPLFLVSFLLSVIFVAAVSYRYFEKPMRLYIRRTCQSDSLNQPSTTVAHCPESQTRSPSIRQLRYPPRADA